VPVARLLLPSFSEGGDPGLSSLSGEGSSPLSLERRRGPRLRRVIIEADRRLLATSFFSSRQSRFVTRSRSLAGR